MPTELDQTTKQRILTAAAEEFAERGYDGARVDTIAKRANVNKALIYYYYENKEDLLELLFADLLTVSTQLMQQTMPHNFDLTNKEAITKIMYSFLDVLEERQNVVRVLIMEFSKRNPINDRIFQMLGHFMETLFSTSPDFMTTNEEERQKSMVTEFFTGIMPVLNYVAYHEIWMERFGIDEATLRKDFIESVLGTHFAFTIPGFPHEHIKKR